MITINSNEDLLKHLDKKTGTIVIDDDIEIAFDGMHTNYNLKCNNIVCKDVLRSISARNISARNISAGNISAVNISAEDISAWNISAVNISAGNIIYYAVCFAYYDIKCASIKGQRANSKHFCLDGTITTKEGLKNGTNKNKVYRILQSL